MTVKQLIEALIQQPMDCQVYIGDVANGHDERCWDGETMGVVRYDGDVFIEFNESGMNNYIDTEVRD